MSVRWFVLLLLFSATAAHADAPRTFNEAKKVAWKLYAPQSTEFYCGCKYTGNKVNLSACASAGRKVDARIARDTIRPTRRPRPICITWCQASVK